MKYSSAKTLAIIILSTIAFFAIYRIYDFASFLISTHKLEEEIDENHKSFLRSQLRWSYLDSITMYAEIHETQKALRFVNYLINTDSNDVSNYVKRGFIYYKNKKFGLAEKDFQKVIESTSYQIGDSIVVNENKEQYYYAKIGLMLVEDTIIDSFLSEYNINRKKSYLELSKDYKNEKLIFSFDSVIMKRYYNKIYE